MFLYLLFPQNLFSSLPNVLNERKGSLSTSSTAQSSKKRPSPSDPLLTRANFSAPNVASPQTPTSDLRGPGRARSFPHDLSVDVSKRHSKTDSASLTPQSFDEQVLQDAPSQNHWSLGNGVVSPTSATTPFPINHFGNPNLPDMKRVMFPSDNPFAYPNQPISTLEAQHFITADQQSAYSSPASSSMYNIGSSGVQQPPAIPFENVGMPAFGGAFGIPQRYVQQGPQVNVPMTSASDFERPSQIEGAGDVTAVNFPAGEGYWAQLDRMNGGRTGLTPGINVNMDELFGGEGWGSVWNHQSFAR